MTITSMMTLTKKPTSELTAPTPTTWAEQERWVVERLLGIGVGLQVSTFYPTEEHGIWQAESYGKTSALQTTLLACGFEVISTTPDRLDGMAYALARFRVPAALLPTSYTMSIDPIPDFDHPTIPAKYSPSHVALRLRHALYALQVGRIEAVTHLEGLEFEVRFTHPLTPSILLTINSRFGLINPNTFVVDVVVPLNWMADITEDITEKPTETTSVGAASVAAPTDLDPVEPRIVNHDHVAITAVCRWCGSQYDAIYPCSDVEQGKDIWLIEHSVSICPICQHTCCHRCGAAVTGDFYCEACDHALEHAHDEWVAASEAAAMSGPDDHSFVTLTAQAPPIELELILTIEELAAIDQSAVTPREARRMVATIDALRYGMNAFVSGNPAADDIAAKITKALVRDVLPA